MSAPSLIGYLLHLINCVVVTKALQKVTTQFFFQDLPQIAPKLVAVSKIKPASLILEAYQQGQKDFGENYVNELAIKAKDPLILENCKDIRWHLIGPLQTNKINKVLSVPGLHMIQTVHSQKLADNLNKQWGKYRKEEVKLAVLVQVNTSGEEGTHNINTFIQVFTEISYIHSF